MAPWGVGFAGAEFVVLGKTVVGVEEVWEVVSEVRACVEAFSASLARGACQVTKGRPLFVHCPTAGRTHAHAMAGHAAVALFSPRLQSTKL